MLPVVGHETGLHQLMEIAFQRQRRDVSIEAPHNRARLRARCGKGASNLNRFPCLLFPLLEEGRDDSFLVGFLRHAVGGEQEFSSVSPGDGR